MNILLHHHCHPLLRALVLMKPAALKIIPSKMTSILSLMMSTMKQQLQATIQMILNVFPKMTFREMIILNSSTRKNSAVTNSSSNTSIKVVSKLADNKKNYLEKNLSAAKRDMILLQESKDDSQFRRKLAQAMDEFTASLITVRRICQNPWHNSVIVYIACYPLQNRRLKFLEKNLLGRARKF